MKEPNNTFNGYKANPKRTHKKVIRIYSDRKAELIKQFLASWIMRRNCPAEVNAYSSHTNSNKGYSHANP